MFLVRTFYTKSQIIDNGYQSKTIRGNYDYDRELSSIDTVPAYILSKFYVFGQGKFQLSGFLKLVVVGCTESSTTCRYQSKTIRGN